MNERPPIPPVLTAEQLCAVSNALKDVQHAFLDRYPGAHTIVTASLQVFPQWEVSYHADNHPCLLARGSTPEEAFASLDRQLGPATTPLERLQWRCDQLLNEARAMEAREVVATLQRLKDSQPLPVSSPA